jgi:hypothetical protein
MRSASASGDPSVIVAFGYRDGVGLHSAFQTTYLLSTTWTEFSGYFSITNNGGTVTNGNIAFKSLDQAPITFFLDDISLVNISPALSISRTNESVLLSWPTNDINYSLQSNTNLFPIVWTPVTNTPQTNGNNLTVTLPAINQIRFFRLISP